MQNLFLDSHTFPIFPPSNNFIYPTSLLLSLLPPRIILFSFNKETSGKARTLFKLAFLFQYISNTYQKNTYHVSKSKKKKEKRLIYPTVPFQRNPPRRSLFEFINEIQAAARSKVEPFAPLEIAAGREGGGDSKSIGGITRRDQSMVEPLSPPPPPLSRREETRPHNGGVGRERGGG